MLYIIFQALIHLILIGFETILEISFSFKCTSGCAPSGLWGKLENEELVRGVTKFHNLKNSSKIWGVIFLERYGSAYANNENNLEKNHETNTWFQL